MNFVKVLKKLFVFSVLLFYVYSWAYALDKFVPIGYVPEGAVYIDTTSIFLNGTVYSCWIRMPNSVENVNTSGNNFFDYALIKIEIDKSKKMHRMLEVITYDNSDRFLNKFDFYSTSFWKPIETGTPIEGAYAVLMMMEQNMPEYLKNEQSLKLGRYRYLYIGASDSKNEFYLDTNSISFNPQTQIVKFEIRTVFDKVTLKKMLNTKRFRSIKRKASSASYIVTSYYIDLSTNSYASIHSYWYSDNGFLFDVEDNCKYNPISSSSLLTKAHEILLTLIR